MTEQPQTRSDQNTREEKFPRALWIRLIIYIAVGHLFAGFIWLLFEVGAK
ncbi:DUF6126 family protein [Streptomyces sp. NPDC052051]|uniref:DUF6126 family protein n=1 Tax=Streptomyces macrolidinus TaxID=2952607 RepID=A0ABT0ZDJ5_9ACTN|nr:DUF6126 family protein [Streptomyces macrolidinus]MCN9241626.1 DUF6126 family protein [Streptomyces macrolidinus]